MWVRVFTVLVLRVITLHCCKTRNDRKNSNVKSEENISININPINDKKLIMLAEYEKNILKQHPRDNGKECDYEDESKVEQLGNLQLWEQNLNLSEGILLKNVKNNTQLKIVLDSCDCNNHQQKFSTLMRYMSQNCLKDIDIFLSMNHEDEWEKYHNEIMQLETQYRKWENNESDNKWKDLKESTTEWVVPPM